MNSYEHTFIARQDLSEKQSKDLVDKYQNIINKNSGKVLKVEKWGKKRLAYRIDRSRFGYYLNVYHTTEGLHISALESDYKPYDLVLKFLVIRLDDRELELAMKRESKDETEERKEPSGKAKKQ